MKNNRRLSKGIIKLIISLSVAIIVAVSLIVTNIFVPVRYLGTYINFSKDRIPQDTMRIRYINVGYGDSTLVELPDGKTLLVDGGTGTYANVHKLLKLLNSSGIDKIDYLVCTSVKSEHCGGLAEIIKYKPVGTAFIPYVKNKNLTDEYAAFYSSLTESGTTTEIAEYGKGIYSHEYGYRFFFLSPTVHESTDSEYNLMNSVPTRDNIDAASIVLWIEYSDRGFLFLSDATPTVQDKIARNMLVESNKYVFDGMELTFSKCSVIKAASHCGPNSLQASLYDIIQPEVAIIPVGKNAQRSPSLEEISVLQLYVGDRLFRTDLSGTITVTVKDGQQIITKEI